jgi:group I intron endonuclease
MRYYGLNNFCLAILEDLGPTHNISKEHLLEREQYYLNILFNKYSHLKLNISPTAGTTLGFKHTHQFKLNRMGKLNPMFGKIFSSKFIEMQTRNKKGINNPMFGIKKSPTTIAKLQKLIYVYDSNSRKLIGIYSTVKCSKELKIGKNTIKKYINTNIPFKGKIFSHMQLD